MFIFGGQRSCWARGGHLIYLIISHNGQTCRAHVGFIITIIRYFQSDFFLSLSFFLCLYKFLQKLEDNWKVIQKEALALMNKETKLFEAEEESLQDTGDWKQYMLYMRGERLSLSVSEPIPQSWKEIASYSRSKLSHDL